MKKEISIEQALWNLVVIAVLLFLAAMVLGFFYLKHRSDSALYARSLESVAAEQTEELRMKRVRKPAICVTITGKVVRVGKSCVVRV
jgi:hypothetical protein